MKHINLSDEQWSAGIDPEPNIHHSADVILHQTQPYIPIRGFTLEPQSSVTITKAPGWTPEELKAAQRPAPFTMPEKEFSVHRASAPGIEQPIYYIGNQGDTTNRCLLTVGCGYTPNGLWQPRVGEQTKAMLLYTGLTSSRIEIMVILEVNGWIELNTEEWGDGEATIIRNVVRFTWDGSEVEETPNQLSPTPDISIDTL